eukprot:gene6299-7021_t
MGDKWLTEDEFEFLQSMFDGRCQNSKSKRNKPWTPKGDYIESAGDYCISVLVYSVTLEKPGNISIVHRAEDDMATFHVKVSNNFCTTTKKGKHNFYLSSEFRWKRTYVPLQQGRNVISLQAAYFYAVDTGSSFPHHAASKPDEHKITTRKSIQVREIKITGLSYTSECTKCAAGTYSKSGASTCSPCDPNTFSVDGSKECTKCNSDEYSYKGSPKCLKKPLCSSKDFYEMWSPCDSNGKTKVSYFWVLPKICDGGVELPKSTNEKPCPPCNPGQFKNGSTCSFCAPNEFSDGTGCKKCPPSTTPDVGLFFTWWQNLPKNIFHFYCFSNKERSCQSQSGWRQYNTYMDSGTGHSDDAKLGIFIEVPSFSKQHSLLTIEFEMKCKSLCRLRLEKRNELDEMSVIFLFVGNRKKAKFTHQLTGVGRRTFHLSFMKPEGKPEDRYEFVEDSVRLYALNITNANNGGADTCISCPLGVGSKGKGCIQCEKGSYLDNNECKKCPKGTYLNAKDPVGRKACKPCSPGTKSDEGSTHCYSDCHLVSKDGRRYDFSALSGSMIRKNGRMFTSHGFPYFRIFNITVCGKQDSFSNCFNNFTRKPDDQKPLKKEPSMVNSSICRSTVIPSMKEKDIFAQAMSLGDYLENITFGSLLKTNSNTTVAPTSSRRRKRRDDDNDFEWSTPWDVNYIFKSLSPSSHCKAGYSTIVTMRCNPRAFKRGYISTSSKCPTGTCDGCLYHFTWHSQYACPLCTYVDYQNITSACIKGEVKTHYVWNFPKLCRDGVDLPKSLTRKCTVFERTILDLKIFLLVFLGMALLLVAGIFILCYRNRKLTYKYSRLVDEAHYKDGELPASEKCTLDEGEEDDELVLSRGSGNGRRILDRLRSKIGSPKNRDDFGDFETINLRERNTEGHSSGDEI